MSCGGRRALQLAAFHPERVLGVFAIAAAVARLTPAHEHRRGSSPSTTSSRPTRAGPRRNRHYRERDYRGYLEFFFGECFPEPHSTKVIEDAVAYGLDTTPEVLIKTECDVGYADRAGAEELCRAVQCPVLLVHGDRRPGSPPLHRSERVAELTGGRLVTHRRRRALPPGPRPRGSSTG